MNKFQALCISKLSTVTLIKAMDALWIPLLVIKNLDLVITVRQHPVSHLASGLGTPTWILLPNPADWRWMIDRNDSPWYPNVTRLFKQPTPGDWKSMISEVADELKKHVARK